MLLRYSRLNAFILRVSYTVELQKENVGESSQLSDGVPTKYNNIIEWRPAQGREPLHATNLT